MTDISHEEQVLIQKGSQAQYIWDKIFSQYYAQSKQNLLDAYESCTYDQKDDMVAINMQLRALNNFKEEIEYFIATGTYIQSNINQRVEDEKVA